VNPWGGPEITVGEGINRRKNYVIRLLRKRHWTA
jgi:hypothetical protein